VLSIGTGLLSEERPKLPSLKWSYGARRKNLNEDRSISLVAKCSPTILVARNIRCMRICARGSIGDRGVSRTISANGLRTYSVAHLYQARDGVTAAC